MDIKIIATYNEDGNSKRDELCGTFENNRIIYTDDAKVIIDLDNKIVTRERSENYKVELDFNNSRCRVYIKEANDYLEIAMHVLKYEHKDNKLTFEYYFENSSENILGGIIEYKNM